MGSSAQAITHQNLETTSSTFQTETITGSHLLKIYGYSLTKGIGKSIKSGTFIVGRYNWVIEVFPDGVTEKYKFCISMRVRVEGEDTERKALTNFTILQQNGAPSNWSVTSPVLTISNPAFRCWGSWEFANRTEFEASEHLKNDSFTVKCIITVIRTKLEVTHPYGVSVPPSNLNQNLANLLESGKGADITFVVKEEIFKAHLCVLAARSDVFNAELLGCMKEQLTDTITVEDIEAPVFKFMLYFMYSDSLPSFDDNGEKQDMSLMAQHLLVAADRYQLERLRLMCENLLCKNISVSNVGTILILAEQHNCSQLRAECVRFTSSPENFKAVAQTDEFHNLTRICPILKYIQVI